VFDEEDIAAYGATTVDDLITAISPQTGSGRGRGSGGPVILVNGQRITNFREMMNYPPDRSAGSKSCPKKSRCAMVTARISGW
jgi:hypothetical protein